MGQQPCNGSVRYAVRMHMRRRIFIVAIALVWLVAATSCAVQSTANGGGSNPSASALSASSVGTGIGDQTATSLDSHNDGQPATSTSDSAARGSAPVRIENPPSDVCDGVAQSADPMLLNPKASVISAVICRTSTAYFPGQGLWSVASIDVLPTRRIPELVHGLTEQDVAPDPEKGCSAVGHIPVDFVLTLSDGSRTPTTEGWVSAKVGRVDAL